MFAGGPKRCAAAAAELGECSTAALLALLRCEPESAAHCSAASALANRVLRSPGQCQELLAADGGALLLQRLRDGSEACQEAAASALANMSTECGGGAAAAAALESEGAIPVAVASLGGAAPVAAQAARLLRNLAISCPGCQPYMLVADAVPALVRCLRHGGSSKKAAEEAAATLVSDRPRQQASAARSLQVNSAVSGPWRSHTPGLTCGPCPLLPPPP